MSTNHSPWIRKPGPYMLYKSATVQDMFQLVLGLYTGLCTGEYGIVYTQYGYVNVYTYMFIWK